MSIVSIISTSISITLKIMAKDKLAHGVRSPVTLSSPLMGLSRFCWRVFFAFYGIPLWGCGDSEKKVKEKVINRFENLKCCVIVCALSEDSDI